MESSQRSPDGGWGWMVVLGAALINMVNQSIFSTFGLIFGEELEAMAGGKATGITLVMALNSMVTNFTGLLIGPLMKKISIRKITVIGIVCTGTGMLLSSFATRIFHIALAYGCLTGFGLGLLSSVTFLAISEHFTERKSTAVGLAMTGTSIGQMLMPMLDAVLLEKYGYSGCTFTLGILSYSGLIGALFFKPLPCCKSSKKETDPLLENGISKSDKNETSLIICNDLEKEKLADEMRPDNEKENTQGFSDLNKQCAAEEITNLLKTDKHNSSHVVMETEVPEEKIIYSKEQEAGIDKPKRTGCMSSFADIIGLTLLKDWRFVHILLGLSFAYVSTVTFGAFFPMFLQDELHYGLYETTSCMTALSFADIVGRTTISEITRKLKMSSRTTFMLGAIILGLCRSCLVEVSTYTYVLIISILIGYARAATVITVNLVVSEYVNKADLPAAVGVNMVGKGLFIVTIGQSLGYLKDAFSFRICIHLLNVIIYSVVFSWSLELAIVKGWFRCNKKR